MDQHPLHSTHSVDLPNTLKMSDVHGLLNHLGLTNKTDLPNKTDLSNPEGGPIFNLPGTTGMSNRLGFTNDL
ncbi:hypothetical protein [Ferroacidibacillus organovorans]|uniref:Uncharacterized protein n=1 Tax=Ferroacidibacillus organovorans TaxID=1765683 RepID=A0A1V4ERL1_9BACL|nr:hypothetical protein [Ferroacidibacillus organovorans]OPG15512.1 hypothetical protein B2M26_10520 [Ferroacidibacillus organovorans]